MTILKPDYTGNTIVNLIYSIYERLGLSDSLNNKMGLKLFEDNQEQLKDRIILIVVDGAGDSFYKLYREVLELDDWYLGFIHSVYPSTTASSITSILTGLTPLEHGIPGWHTYFKDISSVLNILPFLYQHNRGKSGHTSWVKEQGTRRKKLGLVKMLI